MTQLINNAERVAHMRDPQYANLWELAGPQTGLSLLSAAFFEVDVGATSPRAWHEKTEEIYMIVEGKGVMYIGEMEMPIRAGDCISIPLRHVHAVANTGTTPLRMWVVTSPPYSEDDDIAESDGKYD